MFDSIYYHNIFSFLEYLEDLKLAGNCIKENNETAQLVDEMSISDTSTLLTAKQSLTTVTSTSKLLRKNNSGSKAALEEQNRSKSKLDSRRSSIKAKYANMSLEQALALACPSLLTFDGVSMVKKRETDAKNEDGCFHTWYTGVYLSLNALSLL
jgi:hypothetical protein